MALVCSVETFVALMKLRIKKGSRALQTDLFLEFSGYN